jgi:4-hydroxybenzoate polyprenyltransferase
VATAKDYLSLVKFSHSVFALPFALIALLVVTGGAPGWRTAVLVIAAMVGARTAAMAYNRFADRHLDALNARTQNRELPGGRVAPRQALLLTFASSAVFLGCAWLLSPLCLALGVPVLGVLLGYSHAKRFTALSHVWLGVALGLAPPAATIAATGTFGAHTWIAVSLGCGVIAWVAGFDILYDSVWRAPCAWRKCRTCWRPLCSSPTAGPPDSASATRWPSRSPARSWSTNTGCWPPTTCAGSTSRSSP